MKTRFLFPYWCKYLGVAFFLVHLPVVLFCKVYFKDQPGIIHSASGDSGILSPSHLFFVSTTLLMLSGLVLFAFSEEKVEDEQIAQLRMDSLQWAVYLSYIVLIGCLAFTTANEDIKDLVHMHVWVPLMLFIILFRWKMFRNSRYSKEDAV